MRAKFTPNDA